MKKKENLTEYTADATKISKNRRKKNLKRYIHFDFYLMHKLFVIFFLNKYSTKQQKQKL